MGRGSFLCERATALLRMPAKAPRPTSIYVILKLLIEAGLIEVLEHTGRCNQ
jgi:hypothetical protein